VTQTSHQLVYSWFRTYSLADFVAAHPERQIAAATAFFGLRATSSLGYGVRWTGCTVHFVDEEGLDSGPIIGAALVVPVMVTDTEGSRRILDRTWLYLQRGALLLAVIEVQNRRVLWREEEGFQLRGAKRDDCRQRTAHDDHEGEDDLRGKSPGSTHRHDQSGGCA